MQEERIIVPRMATIKVAAKTFLLSEHFPRCLVASGTIVATKAGNKYLVNLGKLAEYLNTTHIIPTKESCDGVHDVDSIAV